MTPVQLDAALDRFVARLRARLAAGAREYGDRSFTRPQTELVDELQQELEDVCGWGLILWLRLDRLRGATDRVGGERGKTMTRTVKLISGVGFTPGTAQDLREGLVGFVTLTFADLLLLDGLTLRRTASGRHALSFPSRTDREGRRHPYYRPQDDRARRLIEDAVFQALGIDRDPQEADHG